MLLNNILFGFRSLYMKYTKSIMISNYIVKIVPEIGQHQVRFEGNLVKL